MRTTAIALLCLLVAAPVAARVNIQLPAQVKLDPEQQAILKDAQLRLKECSKRKLGDEKHAALQMQVGIAYVMQAPRISQMCQTQDYEGVRSAMVATHAQPAVDTFLKTQEACYHEIKSQVKDHALIARMQEQMSTLGVSEKRGEYRSLKTLDVAKLCTMLQGVGAKQ